MKTTGHLWKVTLVKFPRRWECLKCGAVAFKGQKPVRQMKVVLTSPPFEMVSCEVKIAFEVMDV